MPEVFCARIPILWVMERALDVGGQRVEPDVRMLSDMLTVVYDQEWASGVEDVPLYYMYRDLSLSKNDEQRIREKDLRYDITVIPPRNLGVEYVKTAGHYHPSVPGTNTSYTEIYEVLHGEAHYLMQDESATRVYYVEAKQGDKVIIPPGFGHVTINPSNKELKMANWVSRDFDSIYEPIEERRGAAYFETIDGWIHNTQYPDAAELEKKEPTNYSDLGLERGKEMYGLVRDLDKLEFLQRPQDYDDLWDRILS